MENKIDILYTDDSDIMTVFLNGKQVMVDEFDFYESPDRLKDFLVALGFEVQVVDRVDYPEEETIEIPYSWIKYNDMWDKFCEITGYNYYSIRERGEPDLRFTYTVRKSEAKIIGYIK